MKRNITISTGIAAVTLFALSGLYVAIEPAIGLGATTSSQFTISQVVTSEISFKTAPTNVSLSPSLGGLTGGTSAGQTQLVVSTSNSTGYNMTISASSSVGMLGNASSSNYISAYALNATTAPEYTFTVHTPQGAAFGYTVAASTTGDIAQAFLSNGSTFCNTGSTGNTGSGTQHCWLNASTSPVQVLNRNSSTPSSGSTSTLEFQVTINANPNPPIPNDTYVATTTVTATTNP